MDRHPMAADLDPAYGGEMRDPHEEPLDRWVRHDDYCSAIGAKGPCTCGLDEASKAANRSRELDEPNALVKRIATAVHNYILATEPQTSGQGIVQIILGFLR